MEQGMLEILKERPATNYSLQDLLQYSGKDHNLGKGTLVSYLNNCASLLPPRESLKEKTSTYSVRVRPS